MRTLLCFLFLFVSVKMLNASPILAENFTSTMTPNTNIGSELFPNTTQEPVTVFKSVANIAESVSRLTTNYEFTSTITPNIVNIQSRLSSPHVDSNAEQDTELQFPTDTTLQPEKKVSDIILAILGHYKQPDPLGLPGIFIADPMPIPDMTKSFSIGRMLFQNVQVYGLKKFRIEHVVANITEMKVEALLSIDVLNVTGNYTLTTWISRASGPFVVKLEKVQVIATASLEIEENGNLEAQDMDMDITFDTMKMDFQGLGFFANMFQGIMNSVGSFVFDSIKPFILSEANTKIRNDINQEIRKFKIKFSNSIAPVDQLMYKIRRTVRTNGYDPYHLPDYHTSVGIFDVHFSHTWLYGLSSFRRTKDVNFEIKNSVLRISAEIQTGKLVGTTNWEISLVPRSPYRSGTVAYTVTYLKVQIEASQSMNASRPPSLDDIQLELGNVQMRFNGLGGMDELFEIGVNIIPNLLRYQIMDAIEKPIKYRIQETLDQLDIENIIRKNADQLDSGKALEDIQLLL